MLQILLLQQVLQKKICINLFGEERNMTGTKFEKEKSYSFRYFVLSKFKIDIQGIVLL